MPTSSPALIPSVMAHVWEVFQELGRPIRILDVGPGFGRYGFLCRELIDGPERGTRIERLDAIEAEPRYRELFPWLELIYDAVFDGDAADPELAGLYGTGAFIVDGVEEVTETDGGYDLVLMLDVIEHIEHDAALELLDRIPGRVLIATPRHFFDNPEADAGWETERHRSHWPDPASFGRPYDRFDQRAYTELAAVVVRLAARA